ncbi:hypothetical protein C8R45DRAFT_1223785 [Mycena sanguinolenta]|nr:hypothetical protein C8R45DRAFT_1223785 [Mycena sanguinolenta]
MVSLRDSVFYLSYTASLLQPARTNELQNSRTRSSKSPPELDDGQKSRTRFLNHLSTVLSRGRKYNDNEVVAVTASADPLGMEMVVARSPTTTPVSSTHSPNDIGSESAQASSPAALPAVELKNSIVTRNSAAKAKDGHFVRKTLKTDSPDLDFTALAESDIPDDFAEYVVLSLQLLRSAAGNTTDPETKYRLVTNFFLRACSAKVQSRLHQLKLAYGIDAFRRLKEWQPATNEEIESAEVLIRHPYLRLGLDSASIQRLPGNRYLLCTDNMRRWWHYLIDSIGQYHKAASKTNPKISDIAMGSESVHHLLLAIPEQLWDVPSLVLHLQSCRKVASSNVPTGQEDPEPTDEATVPNDNSSPLINEESRAFYRTVDATCAWTVAPIFLLKNKISQTKGVFRLAIIDFPREDINDLPIDSLVDHWGSQGKWLERVCSHIQTRLTASAATTENTASTAAAMEEMTEMKDTTATSSAAMMSGEMAAALLTAATAVATTAAATTEKTTTGETAATTKSASMLDSTGGACHCEAGLIASAFLRQHGEESLEQEPPALRGALSELSCLAPGMPIAIGVAKKCCPVCRMLMEILHSKFQINLHIAGAHSRYHPWVPPQGLTEPVLQELEKQLLAEVADMALKVILGARASSLHSDEETAETIPILYSSPVQVEST